MHRSDPVPLVDPPAQRRCLKTPRVEIEGEIGDGREPPLGLGGQHRSVAERGGKRRLEITPQIYIGFRLYDRWVLGIAEMAVPNRPETSGTDVGNGGDFDSSLDLALEPSKRLASSMAGFGTSITARPVQHPPEELEVQHPGPQRMVGVGPCVEDGNVPASASSRSSHEGDRLGSAVQRHKPVGDYRTHVYLQGVGPANPGFLALLDGYRLVSNPVGHPLKQVTYDEKLLIEYPGIQTQNPHNTHNHPFK